MRGFLVSRNADLFSDSAELQEDRLGRRTLSENPEVWRAAPAESALEWGEDDLDSLPPPAPLHEEEETEVLPGAGGLLRASDMNL